jgi:tetratricopeptide (TPR) repeat protein
MDTMTSDPRISQLLALVEASAARGDDIAAMRDALRAQTAPEDLDPLLDLADAIDQPERSAELCAVLLVCADYESNDERRCAQLFDAAVASEHVGNDALALECAETGARLGGEPDQLRWCSQLLWRCTRRDEADAMLRRSLDADPSDALAWYFKGRMDRSRHRWADAIHAFRRAIELDGAQLRFRRKLASALIDADIDAGTTDHVAEVESILLSNAIVDEPNYWTSIYTAQLFWLKRDEERSTAALRVAQTLAPDGGLLAINVLGDYRLDWGRPWSDIAPIVNELFDAYQAAHGRSDTKTAAEALDMLEELLDRAKLQHPEAKPWIRRIRPRNLMREGS